MKTWKWTRVLRRIATEIAKKPSIRKLLPRPTPPHRYTPRGNVRRHEEFRQRRLTCGAERLQLRREELQPIEGRKLRMVERRAAGREQWLEPVDKGVVTRRNVAFDAAAAHKCWPIRD